MNVPAFTRLPLTFDAAALLAEVVAIPREEWVAHFNAGYHDGGWEGAALRSVGGEARRLHPDPLRERDSHDTELLARCPGIAAALARFQCPKRSVRILLLAAGSVIREHRDDDLRFEEGEARFHIPLATNPGVEFYVDNERVIMEPGECWYLDLSRPHRVQNRGALDRLHLVIDCQVNDWLIAQLEASTAVRRAAAAPSGQQGFADFRALVLADRGLQEELCTVLDAGAFTAKTVALGAAHGCAFGEEDVRAAMTLGRQTWLSQWVL
jgi:mannose-6-phosphate isomerase-like protein (cupin superfamily)